MSRLQQTEEQMRFFRYGNRHILLSLALMGSLGAAGAACAQTMGPQASTPNAVSETQGATTGLGASHRFPTIAAASAHCTTDTVVWSSGPALVYTLPSSPNYGKGTGFYACKSEADDAGFHPSSN